MKRIWIWQGCHAPDAYETFCASWESGDLFIACPPKLTDFSFIATLPPGELLFCGELGGTVLNQPRAARAFPRDPVAAVFTTGTTRAAPRLVFYSKENIVACVDAILELFDRNRIRNIFCYPQPYHVFGLNLGYAMSHLQQLPLVMGTGPYGSHCHALRKRVVEESTLTLATPTHLADLHAHLTGERLAPTYACIIGGAKVDRRLWLLARDGLAIEAPSIGYGCSEAAPGVTHLPPGVEPEYDGEVGWPLRNVQVRLDELGLEFSGPNVCVAFAESGQLTFPTHIRLSDLLEAQDDGRLRFSGRLDLVINRGGEKFSLEQIESALRVELAVEVLCIAVPDERLGQELGILALDSRPVDRAALYTYLEHLHGRRFNARYFKQVARFPVNANAKPDRVAGAALFV